MKKSDLFFVRLALFGGVGGVDFIIHIAPFNPLLCWVSIPVMIRSSLFKGKVLA